VDAIRSVTSTVTRYTSGEVIKDTGNDLKEKGKDLWNDAKGLVE